MKALHVRITTIDETEQTITLNEQVKLRYNDNLFVIMSAIGIKEGSYVDVVYQDDTLIAIKLTGSAA